ncbi:MAG: LLM class flavin-dependent oxidoreductase [Candidatus Bathyarchaeia archaeon]
MGVDLSLGITTSYPIELGVYMASTVDKYNLKSVWIRDDIGVPRDVYAYTSLILASSKKAEAGISIVNPFYYNLSTIARSSATLVELHGERLRLGLRVETQETLNKMDVTHTQTMDELRKTIEALRNIFKGGTESLDTPHYKLINYSLWDRFKVPIILEVRSLELFELASENADGVIISGPKPYLEDASKLFMKAKQSHGLKLLGWLPSAVLTEGGSDIPDFAAKIVAIAAADTPNRVLEASGIDTGKIKLVRQCLLLEDWNRVVRLVDEGLLDQFLFYGSPTSLMDKLWNWARSNGLDEVIFGPPYGLDPEKSISEAASAWVELNSP